jgi:hypothetical protein
MVNAANPAATLMILICFPLVVTGCSPDLLSLRAEALVVSDDAELVAENERGRAQEHSVVAQRAEANGGVLADCRERAVPDRVDRCRAEAVVEQIHRS